MLLGDIVKSCMLVALPREELDTECFRADGPEEDMAAMIFFLGCDPVAHATVLLVSARQLTARVVKASDFGTKPAASHPDAFESVCMCDGTWRCTGCCYTYQEAGSNSGLRISRNEPRSSRQGYTIRVPRIT